MANFADVRRHARRRLPRIAFDYIDGSAGDERCAALNVETLAAVRLQPRVLVNVERRSLRKQLFDTLWDLPFGIAPMGMCELSWPGADAMLTRAARNYGMPLVLSTMASSSIEDTARRAGEHAWFQLYVGQSEEVAFELVERAETVGYEVLVLTVDEPEIGYRAHEVRNGFKSPLRIGPRLLVDFALHPGWSLRMLRRGMPRLANVNLDGGPQFARSEAHGRADWAFLDRLRERWPGRLVVKGVLRSEDALRIRDAGVDAVYVSNHGGRQLDGAPPAIDALARIRRAVGPDYPLLFDSGIRDGEGILKAYACGASFVFLGRPLLYAMGADGERGLRDLVELFARQVSTGLAQLGCPDIEDLDASYLYPDEGSD